MATHWVVYFHNKTDHPITFVLFQENEILEEHSYSVVWHKATAQKGEKVGPIELPADTFVSINSEKPEKVSRGETWAYDGNKLTQAGYDDTPPSILENKSGAPVNVSVWKGEKKVFVQKQLASKESLTVHISDKIFVIESETLNVGDEVQVLAQEQSPTAYELEGDLTIVATTQDGKTVFTSD
eukprot:Phypoly_transcript_21668.p1 GENE.Phypoly_transcript_21668~~Phypoly_transcript_21668.p1  ORF type:complete len:194 (+),score=38.95 Phypoly_transcript_21668:36-584(+)